MSALPRLQAWYAKQCNGEWEHDHGVSIQSCDNPGWWVKVSLVDTPLQGVAFAEVSENIDLNRCATSQSWLSCRVEGNVWHGAGDASKLEVIVNAFLAWAESHGA
jgi:hypothetical protein